MRRALPLVACLLIASSCSDHGLLFSQDRRIEIVAPKQNAKVSMPLTVRWSLDEDVAIGRDIASFAVLFDVDPPPPLKTLAHLARGDLDCERTPGCPDAEYFATRGVYTTTDTEFRIDDLLPIAGVDIDEGERDVHDVTIVVLGPDGRRLNEAFWSRTFEIEHPELDR